MANTSDLSLLTIWWVACNSVAALTWQHAGSMVYSCPSEHVSTWPSIIWWSSLSHFSAWWLPSRKPSNRTNPAQGLIKFLSIILANVLLAKASHTIRSRVHVGHDTMGMNTEGMIYWGGGAHCLPHSPTFCLTCFSLVHYAELILCTLLYPDTEISSLPQIFCFDFLYLDHFISSNCCWFLLYSSIS